MPTLNWMGKEKVVNHHREVPYRVLERVPEKGVLDSHGSDCGNMVIHGDNLEALKALLPEYEGKVDCIYIDPPYNTGEEKWVYNDNVNDPRIRRWIGQVVGKEGEDFTRHDKWLCMMYPRLRLLKDLLARDGFIAVSINDVEASNLGLLLDEIFGAGNRLACAPWRAEKSGGKEKTALRTGHEYIYFYRKSEECRITLEESSTGKLDRKDKFGKYRKGRELNKWGAGSLRADRETMWFPLTAPDGSIVYPIRNDGLEGRWRMGKDNPLIQSILTDPENAHWEINPYDDGVTVDGKTERWVPYEKIRDEKKVFGWNTWLDGYGTNSDATAELKALFGSKVFDTPKPLSLVKWIVSLAYDDDAIILDSFAGSGTTAHAVLSLNAEDGGHRSFILVEMMDYADGITAERVRRAIAGYDNLSPKKAKNAPDHYTGLGGASDSSSSVRSSSKMMERWLPRRHVTTSLATCGLPSAANPMPTAPTSTPTCSASTPRQSTTSPGSPTRRPCSLTTFCASCRARGRRPSSTPTAAPSRPSAWRRWGSSSSRCRAR